MLEKIKLLLGITSTDTDKDNLLMVLIDQAKEEAISYTNNEAVADVDNIICQMVVYKYNRLGTEGLLHEDYSGVLYIYATDYPEGVLKQLKRFKKLGVIKND